MENQVLLNKIHWKWTGSDNNYQTCLWTVLEHFTSVVAKNTWIYHTFLLLGSRTLNAMSYCKRPTYDAGCVCPVICFSGDSVPCGLTVAYCTCSSSNVDLCTCRFTLLYSSDSQHLRGDYCAFPPTPFIWQLLGSNAHEIWFWQILQQR